MANRHFIAIAFALVSGASHAAGADPIAAANNELSYSGGWRNTGGSSQALLNLSASTQSAALYSSAAGTYSFGHTLDFDLKVGNPLNLMSVVQFTPYVGYEHHRWTDVTYNALGFGMLAQRAVAPGFVMGAEGFVGRTFSASMNGDSGAALSPSFALAAGLSADYAASRNVHLTASYRFERFIAKANTQTAMLGIAYAY